MSKDRLSGKTALVTGAAKRIGREITLALADAGANVVVHYRESVQEADKLRTELVGRGVKSWLVKADFDDAEAPARLKAALGDTPLDLLFANAGATGDRSQSFGSVDVENVLQLIRINALAPLKLVEALADNVARSQRKVIAFQSSVMGSVAGQQRLLDSLTPGESGRFFNFDGKELPW